MILWELSVGVAMILLVGAMITLSDLVVMGVGIDTATVSEPADGVGHILVVFLVLIISGSHGRRHFSGFHPQSLMVFIFILF